MKKLKFEQLSVMTAPYLHCSLDYALDSIAGNGFKNVELWAASPHYCLDDWRNHREREDRLREIRRMLDERGPGLSAFYPEQHRQYPYNIASPNRHIRNWSIGHMKEYLEDAVSLGTDRMIICPGWEFIDAQNRENKKRSVESLQIIGEKALELGVDLYIEEMASIHSLFTDSLPKLKELVSQMAMTNIKPCFESYMASVNGESYQDYLGAFGRVGYIHLCDGKNGEYMAIGQGSQDVYQLLKTLSSEKYEGILSISLWGGGYYKDPDKWLRMTSEYIRMCDLIE